MIAKEGDYAYVFASDSPLTCDLPYKLSYTMSAAKAIAAEIRCICPKHHELLDFIALLESICSGHVRLEKQYMLGRDVTVRSILFGGNEVIQLADLPYGGILWLWEDRSVFLVMDRILAIDDWGRGWTVHLPADEVGTESAERELNAGFDAALGMLRMSPKAPMDVVSRLEEGAGRLNSNPLEVGPSLRSNELLRLIRPWEFTQAEEREPASSLFAPLEESVPEPVDIGGVNISEVHMSANHWFELSRDSLRVEWNPRDYWSTFCVISEGRPDVYVHAVDDYRYPVALARFSNRAADQTVDRIIGVAEDILRTSPDGWPNMRWNERLHSALTALVTRRFWASSDDVMMSNSFRLLYEGRDAFAVFSHFTNRKGEGTDYLELKIDADGFDVYDSYSGSLLSVEDGEGWLEQRPENAPKGDEIDYAAVAALAELGREKEHLLSSSMFERLSEVVEYAQKPSTQSYRLYEVEEPRWTVAWAELQKPVLTGNANE